MLISRSLPSYLAPGLVALAVLSLTPACASTGLPVVVRAAVDVPDRFLVETPDGPAPADTITDGSCRSPMVDPRDGARLRLVRSMENRGDYQVPAGRYGVGERELLRLVCNTGLALGIVKR